MSDRHGTRMIEADTFGRRWAVCQCGWESHRTNDPDEAEMAYLAHRDRSTDTPEVSSTSGGDHIMEANGD